MSKLTLIRGLPGSGKSTIAREISEKTGALHYEADQFFTEDGAYFFDPSKVADAHNWCIGCAEMAMDKGRDVVVSNTIARVIWLIQLSRAIDFNFVINN